MCAEASRRYAAASPLPARLSTVPDYVAPLRLFASVKLLLIFGGVRSAVAQVERLFIGQGDT